MFLSNLWQRIGYFSFFEWLLYNLIAYRKLPRGALSVRGISNRSYSAISLRISLETMRFGGGVPIKGLV